MKPCKIPVLLLAVFVLCSVCSCKKKNGAAPYSNARIATVDYSHSGEIEHYRIVYDQNANVDSIIVVGEGTAAGNYIAKSFSYFGSSFSIKDGAGDGFTVYANTAGQILKILVDDTISLHYKGTQMIQKDVYTPKATSPFYTITSVYYTWANGDVTYSGPAGPGGNTYFYDQGHNAQPGDVFRIDDFLSYGRSYIKAARLVKGKLVGADTVERYAYHFDAIGRIDQLIKISNQSSVPDTFVYSYKYY